MIYQRDTRRDNEHKMDSKVEVESTEKKLSEKIEEVRHNWRLKDIQEDTVKSLI